MEATRLKRKKHTSNANVYRAMLDGAHRRAADDGPSPEHAKRVASLEERIYIIAKEDAKAKKPSRGYLQSLSEETSSKVFYRNFKRKQASPDISSYM